MIDELLICILKNIIFFFEKSTDVRVHSYGNFGIIMSKLKNKLYWYVCAN